MKTRALLHLAALLTLPLPAHGIANPASSSPSSASSSAAAASPAATDAAKPGEDRPAAELLALMPADASVVCSRRTADFTLVFALRGDPSGISRDVRIAAQLMSPRVGEETFRQLAQAFSSEARSERMPELFLSLAYSKDESFAVNRTCRRVISTLSLIPGSRNISQGDWNGLSVDLVSVFSEFEPRFNELAGQQLGSRRIAILYRLDGQRLDIRCGEDVDKLMTCDPIDASDPAHADLLLEPSGGEAPSEADASENTTLWCNSEGLKALRSLAEITPTLPGLAPALSLIDEKSPVSFCAEESSCGYRIRAFYRTDQMADWALIRGNEETDTAWEIILAEESIEESTSFTYNRYERVIRLQVDTDVSVTLTGADGTDRSSLCSRSGQTVSIDTSQLEAGTHTIVLKKGNVEKRLQFTTGAANR